MPATLYDLLGKYPRKKLSHKCSPVLFCKSSGINESAFMVNMFFNSGITRKELDRHLSKYFSDVSLEQSGLEIEYIIIDKFKSVKDGRVERTRSGTTDGIHSIAHQFYVELRLTSSSKYITDSILKVCESKMELHKGSLAAYL